MKNKKNNFENEVKDLMNNTEQYPFDSAAWNDIKGDLKSYNLKQLLLKKYIWVILCTTLIGFALGYGIANWDSLVSQKSKAGDVEIKEQPLKEVVDLEKDGESKINPSPQVNKNLFSNIEDASEANNINNSKQAKNALEQLKTQINKTSSSKKVEQQNSSEYLRVSFAETDHTKMEDNGERVESKESTKRENDLMDRSIVVIENKGSRDTKDHIKKSLIIANDSTFINSITNNKEDKNSLTAIDSSENETLNNTETKADTALNAFASNAKDSSKVNQKLGQDSMKTPLASQVNIGEEDFNWATYRYGPVAGVNVASRWMRDVYIPGVSLGVFAEKMLKDRSTLGIKVQYQNIGFRIGQEEMAMSDLDKLNLWVNQARPEIITGNISMISLPITYQFYLNGNKNNSLFASIGVENNLILKENFSFTYRPGNQGIKEWQKSGTFFQPINGLNIGFGKQFTLANNDLVSMKLNFTIPHGEFVGSTRIPVNIMSLEAKYLFFQ